MNSRKIHVLLDTISGQAVPNVDRQNKNGRGIAAMAIVALLFTVIDTQIQYLISTTDPFVIAWFRQTGLVITTLLILPFKGWAIFHTNYLGLQILRGFLTAASAILYIIALKFVPLVEVIAITFIAPIFVCLLAVAFLGEQMGAFRWIVVCIGFLGSFVIIRPGMSVLHPAIFLVLIEALFFALRQVLTRKMADLDSTYSMIAYTAFVGWILLSLPLPWVWSTPQSNFDLLLLINISFLAACAEVLTVMALAYSLAVVVAPVHYSMLVWGTLFSWIVFGHLPDGWVLFGALLIILAGLMLVWQESRKFDGHA